MRRLLLGLFALVILPPVLAADAAGEQQRIAQWVKDLGNDAFAVREAATRQLIAAGKPAIEAASAAAAGNSPEVTRRAFAILNQLARSSDADTVAAVKAALVKLAKSPDQAAAARAVEGLHWFQLRAVRLLEEGGASVTHAVSPDGDKIVGVSFDNAKVIGPNLPLLHELPDLTYVSLSNAQVGDDALAALRGLKKLDYLNLYRSQVTDAGLAHLNELPALRQVPMGETKVTDAGLIHLKDLTQLEYLGLRGNAVTDAGLAHLKKLTNLTGLYLGETKVTDAGLVHLKGMTKMQYLRLHTVAVSDAGLEHLKGMTALQQLDLWDTKVTEAGVAKLAEALPRANVTTKAR
jgi:hypothetical protein